MFFIFQKICLKRLGILNNSIFSYEAFIIGLLAPYAKAFVSWQYRHGFESQHWKQFFYQTVFTANFKPLQKDFQENEKNLGCNRLHCCVISLIVGQKLIIVAIVTAWMTSLTAYWSLCAYQKYWNEIKLPLSNFVFFELFCKDF